MDNSLTRVDVPLTNFACRLSVGSPIAASLFPVLGVQNLSDTIYRIDPLDRAKSVQPNLRAPGAMPNQLTSSAPTLFPYSIVDRSDSFLITDEDLHNGLPILQIGMERAARLTTHAVLSREVQARDLVINTMTTTEAATPGTGTHLVSVPSGDKFNASGATPIDYLTAQAQKVADRIGMRPNTVHTDYQTALKLVRSADFQANYRNVTPVAQNNTGIESLKVQISEMFNVPISNINIADGLSINTAGPTAPAAVYSTIWDRYWLWSYSEAPSREYAGFAVQFLLQSPITDSNGAGLVPPVAMNFRDRSVSLPGFWIETHREGPRKAQLYVSHHYYENAIVNPNAGILLTDCWAS